MGATAGITAQAVGVVGKAYASIEQTNATRAALKAQASVDDANAQIGEWQAADALQRGQRAEQTVRQRTAGLKGTQRAGFAANGVTLDSGSVLDVLTATDYMGERDAQTARINAEKEAWAYRVGATNNRNEARLLGSVKPGSGSAIGSLLTGAGQVAKSWYRLDSASTGFEGWRNGLRSGSNGADILYG